MNVNIHEAKSKLSQILSDIENNEQKFIICRNGKPIAEIHKIESPKHNPLKQNPELKNVKIYEDLTTPLNSEQWPLHLR